MTGAIDNTSNTSLIDRRLLVTGAGSGIGRAFLGMALADGAHCVAVARDEAEKASLLDDFGPEKLSPEAVLVGDLTRFEWTQGLVSQACGLLGGLDGLVCSAGIFEHRASAQTALEDWRRVMDINLTAGFLLARDSAAVMTSGAAIVLLSSQIGLVGHRQAAAYAASKSAVNGLIRSLALELAERNIRANAVAPGPIATPMTQVARTDPQRATNLVSSIPMGRFGEAQEVAAAIRFLMSPAASFITGQILCVDGGFTAA